MIRRLLGLAIIVSVVAIMSSPGVVAAQATGDTGRVIVVAAPRLEWADVDDVAPPALVGFLDGAATALLSVRAIGPLTGLAEGFVTIGAGNRATFSGALVRPITSDGSGGGVTWSMRPARLDADRKLYDAEPGALGSALHDAGLTTALVGGPPSAALAIADRAGRIDIVQSIAEPLPDADVVLVVLDDLEHLESGPPRTVYERPADRRRPPSRADAVRALDTEFAAVLADTRPDDLVLIVAPAAAGDRGRLTVFAARGPGVEPGAAQSATTRRPHYVTLSDIAPTILDRLGAETPDAVNGTPITGGHGERGSPAWLDGRAERALYRDRTIGPVSVVYIVAQVLTYAVVARAVSRGRGPVVRSAVGVALTILAYPTVTFLSGLVPYRYLPLPLYVVAVAAAAAGLAWVAHRLAGGPVIAAAGLVAFGWAVQVIDITTGGQLQLDTPFGYSPIVAGRFQGFGNLSFSILAISALVVMTARWPVAGGATRARAVWAAGVIAGITLVADGLPRFGADVGGVLAFLPAAAVTLLVLTDRRVNATRIGILGATAASVLALFAWLDHRRPAADRTHLARFTDRLLDGEAGSILRRKLAANLHILTSSIWTWLMPFALVFLVVVMTRPRGALAELQRTVPGLRAALSGAAVLAVLGFALNDSGIAIPAMMCGVLLPWIVVLLGEQHR